MVKSAPIAAVAASLLLCGADALYTKQSPVLQVEGRTYDSLIAQSNHTSIVEFYAPWCGHCKNLQPAYEKAAKSLAGLAKVAAVNCDEEANKPLCGRMEVKGFPTLKIVRPGKKPGRPSVEDYNGQRTAKGIVDAVIDKIPNHVKRLKDTDYEEWAAAEGTPKAILFTDKGTVSALLRAVAIDFLGGLEVGQIRSKETKAVEAYGVTTFPTLILLPEDGTEAVKYDGELKKDAIVKFLSQAATPNPDPAPIKKKQPKTDKKKASSASSKFSKSSASQASKQAQTDAASQTDETIVDNPTDSPSPQVEPEQKPINLPKVAPSITLLTEELSLQHKCLNDKAGTCVLALIPEDSTSEKTAEAVRSLGDLHHKHESAKRNLFPFYQLPASNAQASALRTKLDLSPTEVEIIAVNGKRSWWRHYKSADFKLSSLEDWVDAIRMGDSPKQKVPEGLIVDAAELPPEPVEPVKAKSNPDIEALKESVRDQIPPGMDFDFDEIDDETWANILKQSENAPEAAAPAEEKPSEAAESLDDEAPVGAAPVDSDHDEL